MTCKDCLHFKACYEMAAAFGTEEFNILYANKCEDFANRSEWVHWPCKVGTVVYIPEIEVDKIEKKLITKIHRTTVDEYSVNARYIMYHTKKGNNFTDSMVGKTVFLTHEEAEKALEGRKA